VNTLWQNFGSFNDLETYFDRLNSVQISGKEHSLMPSAISFVKHYEKGLNDAQSDEFKALTSVLLVLALRKLKNYNVTVKRIPCKELAKSYSFFLDDGFKLESDEIEMLMLNGKPLSIMIGEYRIYTSTKMLKNNGKLFKWTNKNSKIESPLEKLNTCEKVLFKSWIMIIRDTYFDKPKDSKFFKYLSNLYESIEVDGRLLKWKSDPKLYHDDLELNTSCIGLSYPMQQYPVKMQETDLIYETVNQEGKKVSVFFGDLNVIKEQKNCGEFTIYNHSKVEDLLENGSAGVSIDWKLEMLYGIKLPKYDIKIDKAEDLFTKQLILMDLSEKEGKRYRNAKVWDDECSVLLPVDKEILSIYDVDYLMENFSFTESDYSIKATLTLKIGQNNISVSKEYYKHKNIKMLKKQHITIKTEPSIRYENWHKYKVSYKIRGSKFNIVPLKYYDMNEGVYCQKDLMGMHFVMYENKCSGVLVEKIKTSDGEQKKSEEAVELKFYKHFIDVNPKGVREKADSQVNNTQYMSLFEYGKNPDGVESKKVVGKYVDPLPMGINEITRLSKYPKKGLDMLTEFAWTFNDEMEYSVTKEFTYRIIENTLSEHIYYGNSDANLKWLVDVPRHYPKHQKKLFYNRVELLFKEVYKNCLPNGTNNLNLEFINEKKTKERNQSSMFIELNEDSSNLHVLDENQPKAKSKEYISKEGLSNYVHEVLKDRAFTFSALKLFEFVDLQSLADKKLSYIAFMKKIRNYQGHPDKLADFYDEIFSSDICGIIVITIYKLVSDLIYQSNLTYPKNMLVHFSIDKKSFLYKLLKKAEKTELVEITVLGVVRDRLGDDVKLMYDNEIVENKYPQSKNIQEYFYEIFRSISDDTNQLRLLADLFKKARKIDNCSQVLQMVSSDVNYESKHLERKFSKIKMTLSYDYFNDVYLPDSYLENDGFYKVQWYHNFFLYFAELNDNLTNCDIEKNYEIMETDINGLDLAECKVKLLKPAIYEHSKGRNKILTKGVVSVIKANQHIEEPKMGYKEFEKLYDVDQKSSFKLIEAYLAYLKDVYADGNIRLNDNVNVLEGEKKKHLDLIKEYKEELRDRVANGKTLEDNYRRAGGVIMRLKDEYYSMTAENESLSQEVSNLKDKNVEDILLRECNEYLETDSECTLLKKYKVEYGIIKDGKVLPTKLRIFGKFLLVKFNHENALAIPIRNKVMKPRFIKKIGDYFSLDSTSEPSKVVMKKLVILLREYDLEKGKDVYTLKEKGELEYS